MISFFYKYIKHLKKTMTDRPISDLNVAQGNLSAGDFFIVNRGNASTERVDFGKLLDALSDGGGGDPDTPGIGGFGFAPQFHNWPSSLNYTGTFSAWSGQILNLHGTGADTTKTIKMPKNADRALISFQYTASVTPQTSQGEPGYNIVQFGGGLQLSGATAAAGCGTSTSSICLGANLNQYTNRSSSEAQPSTSFISSISPVKFSMLSFAPGADVTFNVYGTLQRAKKASVLKSAGRMIVFPFSSAAINIATMQEMIDGFNSNNDYDIAPDPLPGEEGAAKSEYLTDMMKYIVDIGRKIKDDINFDGNAVSPNDAGSPQTQGKTLDQLMAMVYTIKSDAQQAGYTKTFEQIEQELTDIRESMLSIPGLAVSFPSVDPDGSVFYL